jgi:hypothetical protein
MFRWLQMRIVAVVVVAIFQHLDFKATPSGGDYADLSFFLFLSFTKTGVYVSAGATFAQTDNCAHDQWGGANCKNQFKIRSGATESVQLFAPMTGRI